MIGCFACKLEDSLLIGHLFSVFSHQKILKQFFPLVQTLEYSDTIFHQFDGKRLEANPSRQVGVTKVLFCPESTVSQTF